MKPCDRCGAPVKADIHEEELGMCLDCSNEYFEHDHPECSWACMFNFWAGRKVNSDG